MTHQTRQTQTVPFLKVIESDLDQVQTYLNGRVISAVQLVTETTQYNLTSGGKRFRPALLILSARVLGLLDSTPIPMAAAVEMVHTATLVHDDLVDGASMRRGRLTTKKMWGDGVSVLTGDYLFTKAFHIISSQGDVALSQIMSDVAVKMCEAELLQISCRGNVNTAEEDYLRVIYGKTASFIEGCCQMGARLANATPETEAILSTYGLKIGMAFQMADDLLNFKGEETDLGKPIWNDLKEGKFSLPILVALRESRGAARESFVALLHRSETEEDVVPEILKIVEESGGVAYARERSQRYVTSAKEEVLKLPASDYRDALLELADYVIERDR